VVIGGGAIAERKVRGLLQAEACVAVVSPELTPELREMVKNGHVDHIAGGYESGQLECAAVVIAATDDQTVNRRVFEEAQARGILVNVVDDPELCTFFAPAVVRRGDLTISVSTDGKSPSLSRRIRERIEACYGPEYGEFARLLGEIRDEVIGRKLGIEESTRAFKRILDSDVLNTLITGDYEKAKARALEFI